MVTLRKYAIREPVWAKGEIKRMVYLVAMALLLEEKRWAKFIASIQGLFDGAAGRLGVPPKITGSSLSGE
jgi:hypothetical protein